VHHYWDVSSDGKEIITVRTTVTPPPARDLRVVTGWLAGLG